MSNVTLPGDSVQNEGAILLRSDEDGPALAHVEMRRMCFPKADQCLIDPVA